MSDVRWPKKMRALGRAVRELIESDLDSFRAAGASLDADYSGTVVADRERQRRERDERVDAELNAPQLPLQGGNTRPPTLMEADELDAALVHSGKTKPPTLMEPDELDAALAAARYRDRVEFESPRLLSRFLEAWHDHLQTHPMLDRHRWEQRSAIARRILVLF